MHTVLGILGVIVFIACVVAFAAGVTFVVVRFSPPQKRAPEQPPKPESSS